MRILLLTLLCFSFFLSVVFYRCTEVRIMLLDAMASLHPTVVVSAMNDMANSFENGMGLLDTVKEALRCYFPGGSH